MEVDKASQESTMKDIKIVQKLLKPIENNLERVFMTKQQNNLFFEAFFSNLYKTSKTTGNLLKNEQFSKTPTKLKVGEGH